MSRYRKVELATWSDAKFMSLSQDGKFLWLFLLTGPMSTNIPGVVQGGPAAIAEALEWSAERFRERFRELSAKGMANADFRARLIWLPKALRYNAPQNQNVVKGWRDTWKLIPECELKLEVWRALKPYGERFTERFAELLPEPSAICSATQEQEQDQDLPPYSPPTGGQLELTNPEPSAETPFLPGEKDLRPERARKHLSEYRDEALRQFERQNILRAQVRKRLGQGAKDLKPTAERVAKIAERLAAGATAEECEYVLQVYAAEALKLGTTEHFNGMTNWRQENFNRALGKPIPQAKPKFKSRYKDWDAR